MSRTRSSNGTESLPGRPVLGVIASLSDSIAGTALSLSCFGIGPSVLLGEGVAAEAVSLLPVDGRDAGAGEDVFA